MNAIDNDRKPDILTPEQAADLLQIPSTTLAVWRSTGRVALPFVRIGGHVRYPRAELEQYLAERIQKEDM